MNRIVATLEREEEEAGFVKTHRNKRRPDEGERRDKDKKTRRSPKVQLIELSPNEEAAKPPEEKKMENRNNGNNATRPAPVTTPRFEICPLCGFYNKSVKAAENGEQMRYLVCKGDNDRYLAYAKQVAEDLAAGKNLTVVLSKTEWVLSQLDIPRFEQELEAARQMRVNPAMRIDEKIRTATNGKTLPREVLVELRAKISADISRDDYFLVRRLFARLEAARKLKPELEQMIAERTAKKAAAPAPSDPVPEPVNS